LFAKRNLGFFFDYFFIAANFFSTHPPELIQGPGVLPNWGGKQVVKREGFELRPKPDP